MRESRVVAVLTGALALAVFTEWSLRDVAGPAARTARFLYPFAIAIGASSILQPRRRRALAAIGLRRPVVPGLVVGAVAVVPMAVVLAVSSPGISQAALADPVRLVEMSFGAGAREELFFRGLIFLHLWHGTRLGFRGAMVVSALLFGALHLPGQWATSDAGDLLGVLAITAVGGAFYAWLVAEWDSLWVAVALHGGMNFVWALFDAGDNAVGGQNGNLARIATIGLMIALTERHRRARNRG